jgi:flavin reductase (DIM6/NTAB) family NADH-FMN oxidoreductase RutF
VIDGALFRRGMRRLAAGVSIVTTIEGDTPHGLVVTSVSSVCAEPEPSLLICINRDSSSHDVIDRAKVFCVNVLSSNDMELAQRFSLPEFRGRRFEHCAWTPLVTGAPALPSALASFDCEITHVMPVHSHTIFVGAVRDLKLWQSDVDALLYLDGQYQARSFSAA